MNECIKKWKLDWGEASPSPCASAQPDCVSILFLQRVM